MSFKEVYQTYNQQNKQFVKRDGRTGQIIDNSYNEFESIPFLGKRPEELKQAEKNTEGAENDTAESNNGGAGADPEEDESGIFEWF